MQPYHWLHTEFKLRRKRLRFDLCKIHEQETTHGTEKKHQYKPNTNNYDSRDDEKREIEEIMN